MTLEPDTEVVYKVTNYYAREHDHGILWNDPALRIEWPVEEAKIMVSEKDRANPTVCRCREPVPMRLVMRRAAHSPLARRLLGRPHSA